VSAVALAKVDTPLQSTAVPLLSAGTPPKTDAVRLVDNRISLAVYAAEKIGGGGSKKIGGGGIFVWSKGMF